MKILLLMSLLLVSVSASANQTSKEFVSYVEGALEVYSQFKRPSKAESERFYGFVQSKWTKTYCKHDCSSVGYNIAKQYAKEKKVEIKSKDGIQERKGEV